MEYILSAIVRLREERGWSEYRLAELSGVPQSTISSWYRKGAVPTVTSLEKICKVYDITLSQLFADGHPTVTLTESQQKLFTRWSRLTKDQQDAVFQLIDKM